MKVCGHIQNVNCGAAPSLVAAVTVVPAAETASG